MKRKTAGLFSMLCTKIMNTENTKRSIIVLLTDTDERI